MNTKFNHDGYAALRTALMDAIGVDALSTGRC